MSGYFGAARLDGRPVDERLLARIADRLAFRGPQGTNVWRRNGIGSCFTLLRTNAPLQSERQPVVQSDHFFLWGDIRLDARAELYARLAETSPAPSAGLTNEELLLFAWNRWGEQALDRIIGDFSFALWDAREASLVCVRDFIGARPLYYAQFGEVLYFGNTLNVFLGVPEISSELDELFVADFLLNGFCDEPERTAFRDVKRLPSGHILRFSKSETAVRRFLQLPVEEPLRLSQEREYLDAYLEVLADAVRDRLPQGPAALFLSGGLDSASVCAVAADIAGASGGKDKLKAFTLGWQPFFDDPEPELAGLAAAQLGLAHEVLTDAELIPFAAASSQGWQLPEPCEAYFFQRHKRQMEIIASFSSVVLGGDGGDDVLAGHSWPYLVQLWRNGEWKKIAEDFGGYLWNHRRFPAWGAGLRAKAVEFFHPRDEYEGYPRWLSGEFEAKLNLRERWRQSANPVSDEHPLHGPAYRALHDGLWASVLETDDAGWSGVALEARAPLLDLRVLQFMLRLPTVPWCVNKELSRRAMETKLPHAIVSRPKTPLRYDPLAHARLPSGWPESLWDAGIERFVNWKKWCETLRESEGSLSWRSLRPISLLLWLKAVEIRMGFK